MTKSNKETKSKEASRSERHFGIVKEKVSRDEFIVLEKRVAVLEKTKR